MQLIDLKWKAWQIDSASIFGKATSIFGKEETAESEKITHQHIKIKRYETSHQPVLMQLTCNNENNWQQTCLPYSISAYQSATCVLYSCKLDIINIARTLLIINDL